MRCCRLAAAGAVIAMSIAAPRRCRAEDRPVDESMRTSIADNALFAGVRAGAFVPYGGIYADRTLITTPFRDVAGPGAGMELDVGARFWRRFIAYAFFEQAFLGRGNSSAWTDPHGGQSAPSTQALGLGLRWESNLEGLGVLLDVAVGYRWFSARWADMTIVRMGGPGDVRLGLGLNWRAARRFTVAPIVSVSSGAFTERTLDGQPLGEMASSYGAVTFALALGADVL